MTSRRQFLAGAAAAGVAAFVTGPELARASIPQGMCHPMLYGTSQATFTAMSALMPNVATARAYLSAAHGVPATWPGLKTPPGVKNLILSFTPNVPDLLGGKLDHQLRRFIRQAAPGSFLTAHHEANGKWSYFQKQGWSPSMFVDMSHYLHDLVRRFNPAIRYGLIFGGSGSEDYGAWTAPGLDFYGLDNYAFNPNSWNVWGLMIDGIRAVDARAPIAITETNAANLSPRKQNAWFRDTYELANRNRMIAYATFWGPCRCKTPNFDPKGTYVPTLRRIAKETAC